MQSSRSTTGRHAPASVFVALVCILGVAATLTGCSAVDGGTSATPKPAGLATYVFHGGVRANWQPAKASSDVTSYRMSTNPGHGSCTTSSSHCWIGGLTNGHIYLVSVQSVGSGGMSRPVSSRVTAGAPWAPVYVSGTPGDTSVTVTWSGPGYPGAAPISKYVVKAFPGGTTCVTTIKSCVVTGLTNGDYYHFQVTAQNAFGTSAPSEASELYAPLTTAGGSAGIDYLGPVNASVESTTGTILQRDAGISVALPSGRDLWIFGDTSSFSADASQSNAFIGGSTAAKGRYVPGQTPGALKDIQPAGSGSNPNQPKQFIPTPTDTYMPDGSGRACTTANGAVYTARWPTGAALLDAKDLFVTYTDVCVTSSSSFTVEGWGYMIDKWRSNKIISGPDDVFPPASNGAALAPSRTYQSPIVANGQITLFTSSCTALYITCSGGSVFATSVASTLLALANPAAYTATAAVTDGTAQWTPVNVSVAAYPSGLRLIEQTSIGGTFTVFSSTSPAGPWHPFITGTLPGCSTTPKGFCYAFVGHPELGSNTSLVVSYFKPDSPESANVGHVDLAAVPVTPG